MYKIARSFIILSAIIFTPFVFIQNAFADVKSNRAQTITTERIVVHSEALIGNLEGNSPERSVIVYLPPGYKNNPEKRYAVVYALHGYSINNDIWTTEIKTPQSIDAAFVNGAKEMIVVLPNSQTVHNGSMYSSSVTTGDWESFIADDLVKYIDAHYRTIANRDHRGLAGHSMGGYGTIRIGMKRPDVFSVLYSMSPCCLSARGAPPAEVLAKYAALKSIKESTSLGFFERATLAAASAWSPNPNKPPFYFDLPIGDDTDSVLARWAANAPNSMVSQYVFSLRKYKAIAIDVGDRDYLKNDAEKLSKILQEFSLNPQFEIYKGDHVSGVAERFEKYVIPFFSEQLK